MDIFYCIFSCFTFEQERDIPDESAEDQVLLTALEGAYLDQSTLQQLRSDNRLLRDVSLTGLDHLGAIHGIDAKRQAPPAATILEFPVYCPKAQPASSSPSPLDRHAREELVGLFSSLRKPSELTSAHINALGIDYTPSARFDKVIPDATYLPPSHWNDPAFVPQPTVTSDLPRLSNGKPSPSPSIYHDRRTELLYANTPAFRAITREPPLNNAPPARPGQFYKFWQGLETMSQYWDASLDDYGPPAAPLPSNSASSSSAVAGDAMNVEIAASSKRKAGGDPEVAAAESGKRKAGTYSGRRFGTGSDLPPRFREETISALVDTVAWMFGCQTTAPRVPPRVMVRPYRLPVRLSYQVHRMCANRTQARRGWVEGPVCGLLIRGETRFRGEEDEEGEGTSDRADWVRTMGAMIMLAQERRRETAQAQADEEDGPEKWWRDRPRWGGGPGGEIGNGKTADEIVSGSGAGAGNSNGAAPPGPAASEAERATPTQPKRMSGTARLLEGINKKRQQNMTSEADVPPGSGSSDPGLPRDPTTATPGKTNGCWDPRTHYLSIGKEPGSEWDNIFMLSSVNHHVCLLRLQVSDAYVRCLEHAKWPGTDEAEQGWATPHLWQTRWYDLFEAEDRVELLRGLWGIFAYQMREISS